MIDSSFIAQRNEMVEANLPLVTMLLRRSYWKNNDREDLYQQGCIGLIKASSHYDPSRNICFSTYATPFILGEMHVYIQKQSFLKQSRHDHQVRKKLHAAYEVLTQRLHRIPTMTELACFMQITPRILPAYMLSPHRISYTDALQCPESCRWMDRLMFSDIIERLSFQEQTLFTLRYAHQFSQQKTATMLGISQAQVSRLDAKLRKKLYDGWYRA